MSDRLEKSRLWNSIQKELGDKGYTLKKRLSGERDSGSSSNSRVWLADYRINGANAEQRALKISSTLMMDIGERENGSDKLDELTQRELDIARKLDHTNIPHFKEFHRVPIENLATIDVLAMEYIEAPTLLERIDKKERLNESQAKILLRDTLAALDYVHTGLEAVDTDDLPFSPKFQTLLRKLTSGNPAYRYQTAKQALEDLNNLDNLSEEQLGAKLETIVRSNGLQKMLKKIKAEDSLFDYNVPSNIRTTYDDDNLIKHLERIYSQDCFTIDDPDMISKYAQQNDAVIKKGNYKEVLWSLEKGAKGKIVGIKDSGNIDVKFEGIKIPIEISPVSAQVIGEKYPFWKGFGANILNEPIRADSYQTNPITNGEPLKKGLLVQYIAAPFEKTGDVIPDGTKGVITAVYISKQLFITFAKTKGLRQTINWHDSQSCNGGFKQGISFGPESIKLIRENPINYKKLYSECFLLESKVNGDKK